jgi:holo-[acyl-carrier protein] synthase
MILGIGTDMIEVARIKNAVAKEEFKRKVFSVREIAYCESQKPEQSYAARFAAKEAFFKAMGTGWREGMGFAEVEILNDALGKPEVHLSGKALELFTLREATHIHVTLSHLRDTAVAFIIIEK